MIPVIGKTIISLLIVFGLVGPLVNIFQQVDEHKRWFKIMEALYKASVMLAILFILSVILISIFKS